jgi:predicted nucleotide-binding protein (sugar kinase/HSP70/actin superfamily)
MDNTLTIKCPKCHDVLIVDRITGEILEVRSPLVENSSGDRFADAFKKVKSSAQEAEDKFQRSKEAEKNKKRDLDALFEKSLEQAKKEDPGAKPLRGIDLE